jgi:hypothetical protein
VSVVLSRRRRARTVQSGRSVVEVGGTRRNQENRSVHCRRAVIAAAHVAWPERRTRSPDQRRVPAPNPCGHARHVHVHLTRRSNDIHITTEMTTHNVLAVARGWAFGLRSGSKSPWSAAADFRRFPVSVCGLRRSGMTDNMNESRRDPAANPACGVSARWLWTCQPITSASATQTRPSSGHRPRCQHLPSTARAGWPCRAPWWLITKESSGFARSVQYRERPLPWSPNRIDGNRTDHGAIVGTLRAGWR